MSWKPEVMTLSGGAWSGNALVFETREEARQNVEDLANRWYAVTETRTVESTDKPNYRYVDHTLLFIQPTED